MADFSVKSRSTQGFDHAPAETQTFTPIDIIDSDLASCASVRFLVKQRRGEPKKPPFVICASFA